MDRMNTDEVVMWMQNRWDTSNMHRAVTKCDEAKKQLERAQSNILCNVLNDTSPQVTTLSESCEDQSKMSLHASLYRSMHGKTNLLAVSSKFIPEKMPGDLGKHIKVVTQMERFFSHNESTQNFRAELNRFVFDENVKRMRPSNERVNSMREMYRITDCRALSSNNVTYNTGKISHRVQFARPDDNSYHMHRACDLLDQALKNTSIQPRFFRAQMVGSDKYLYTLEIVLTPSIMDQRKTLVALTGIMSEQATVDEKKLSIKGSCIGSRQVHGIGIAHMYAADVREHAYEITKIHLSTHIGKQILRLRPESLLDEKGQRLCKRQHGKNIVTEAAMLEYHNDIMSCLNERETRDLERAMQDYGSNLDIQCLNGCYTSTPIDSKTTVHYQHTGIHTKAAAKLPVCYGTSDKDRTVSVDNVWPVGVVVMESNSI